MQDIACRPHNPLSGGGDKLGLGKETLRSLCTLTLTTERKIYGTTNEESQRQARGYDTTARHPGRKKETGRELSAKRIINE